MTGAVCDTSAAIAVVAGEPHAALRERLAQAGTVHAPHLIDVEVLHALRGMVMRGALDAYQATAARATFAEIPMLRYPHEPLADQAWLWRNAFSAYDAMFVALAAALEMPLVTCDRRLARTASRFVEVETFGPGAT